MGCVCVCQRAVPMRSSSLGTPFRRITCSQMKEVSQARVHYGKMKYLAIRQSRCDKLPIRHESMTKELFTGYVEPRTFLMVNSSVITYCVPVVWSYNYAPSDTGNIRNFIVRRIVRNFHTVCRFLNHQ